MFYLAVKKYFKFKFPSGIYSIESNSKNDDLLAYIQENQVEINKLILEKYSNTSLNKSLVAKITDYLIITKFEIWLQLHQKSKEKDNLLSDLCSICMCELYDNLDKMKYEDIINQLKIQSGTDVIKLTKCEGHYFHLECMENMIKSSEEQDFIQCPICCFIYGIKKGFLSDI